MLGFRPISSAPLSANPPLPSGFIYELDLGWSLDLGQTENPITMTLVNSSDKDVTLTNGDGLSMDLEIAIITTML